MSASESVFRWPSYNVVKFAGVYEVLRIDTRRSNELVAVITENGASTLRLVATMLLRDAGFHPTSAQANKFVDDQLAEFRDRSALVKPIDAAFIENWIAGAVSKVAAEE